MAEEVVNPLSLKNEQKLHAQETLYGNLAIYQTSAFGLVLTLNDQIVLSEHDCFLYHEMMSHPALFTHSNPEKIAIIGNSFGIVQEVVKHPNIKQIVCITENIHLEEIVAEYFSFLNYPHDQRVQKHVTNPAQWLTQCEPGAFDVIIQTHSGDALSKDMQIYYQAINSNGLLVQSSNLSLLNLGMLKPILQKIQQEGFSDVQTLNIPLPSYPFGGRIALLATKNETYNRIREKDIFNRAFTTKYYNYDTHKAALALPEFARKELDT